MPHRPAIACPATPLFVSPVQQRLVIQRAANDNAARIGHDTVLRDALKHFARHGLAAAEVARQEAEKAFFADDRRGYDHWLSICRALDRRMAAAFAAHTARPAR